MGICGGRVFHAEGTASVEVPRQQNGGGLEDQLGGQQG